MARIAQPTVRTGGGNPFFSRNALLIGSGVLGALVAGYIGINAIWGGKDDTSDVPPQTNNVTRAAETGQGENGLEGRVENSTIASGKATVILGDMKRDETPVEEYDAGLPLVEAKPEPDVFASQPKAEHTEVVAQTPQPTVEPQPEVVPKADVPTTAEIVNNTPKEITVSDLFAGQLRGYDSVTTVDTSKDRLVLGPEVKDFSGSSENLSHVLTRTSLADGMSVWQMQTPDEGLPNVAYEMRIKNTKTGELLVRQASKSTHFSVESGILESYEGDTGILELQISRLRVTDAGFRRDQSYTAKMTLQEADATDETAMSMRQRLSSIGSSAITAVSSIYDSAKKRTTGSVAKTAAPTLAERTNAVYSSTDVAARSSIDSQEAFESYIAAATTSKGIGHGSVNRGVTIDSYFTGNDHARTQASDYSRAMMAKTRSPIGLPGYAPTSRIAHQV